MTPSKTISRYFEAWNRHDPAAIIACFTGGGTYHDPFVPEGIRDHALARYCGGFFFRVPESRFDIVSTYICNDVVIVEWVMSAPAANPLAGVDVITLADGKIQKVMGYFDRTLLNFR